MVNTPITRSPLVGEALTLRVGSVEHRVTVVAVFAAVARVRLPDGNIVRAHVVQLYEV
jgi:hypothetical protein